MLLSITAAEKTGQNHHPLGVNRLPEVHLTLDIDNPAAARVDRGTDTRGQTEYRITHLKYGQPVALADRSAIGVDQNDARQHVFMNARADPSGTGFLGAQGTFDVRGIGDRVTRQLAGKVGLGHQLKNIADARREPLLVLGQPGAVGQHPGNRRRGKRGQPLLRGTGFQQLGHAFDTVRRARQILIEIHQHAKHFLEVRIQILQRVIHLTRADDHHLHIQRNHLGGQGYRRQSAHIGPGRLHLQLARMQGTLEGVPDKGLAQQLLGFQQQKTAVCPMQCAGADMPITGYQRALLG